MRKPCRQYSYIDEVFASKLSSVKIPLENRQWYSLSVGPVAITLWQHIPRELLSCTMCASTATTKTREYFVLWPVHRVPSSWAAALRGKQKLIFFVTPTVSAHYLAHGRLFLHMCVVGYSGGHWNKYITHAPNKSSYHDLPSSSKDTSPLSCWMMIELMKCLLNIVSMGTNRHLRNVW